MAGVSVLLHGSLNMESNSANSQHSMDDDAAFVRAIWNDVAPVPPAKDAQNSLYDVADVVLDAASDASQRVANYLQLWFPSSPSTANDPLHDLYVLDEDQKTSEFASESTSHVHVYILGRCYVANNAVLPQACLRDISSRIHCTYRSQFQYNLEGNFEQVFSSDIGWGCMLRTAQSLIAQAFLFAHLGREWRLQPQRASWWQNYTRVLSWFADTPEAPFSLHRMAQHGAQHHGKPIGEWYGPYTVATVLKDLVIAYPDCGLAIQVFSDGTVYKDQILHASLADSNASTQHWARPVLVLVVVRLGLSQLNPIYHPGIKACLALPCCVGIAGGRPDASLYFIGFENDYFLYLDPHRSQLALPEKPATEYTAADCATYHTLQYRRLRSHQLDPCMMIGFYLASEKDMNALFSFVPHFEAMAPFVFSIGDTVPVYKEDLDFGKVSDADWN